VDTFIQSLVQLPIVQQQAPDLIVKAQSSAMGVGQLSPILEELADRITPPQFKKPKPGEGPDPQQLQQQVAEAGQQVQQLNAMIQKLTQEIQTKQVEQQGKIEQAHIEADKDMAMAVMDHATKQRIATAELASKERQAAMDRETKLAVAELGAKEERIRLFIEERARLGAQIEDATQEHLNRAHEAAMLTLDHATAMAQGDQAHQQALEQGDQGFTHDLATASAVPPPAKAVAPKPKAEAPTPKPSRTRRTFERDPSNGLITSYTDAPVAD
jgi:hypothetical protein